MTDLLRVDDLCTHFDTRAGMLKAVDGVSFSLAPGEVLGLVGESGSGKSVTGFSILGLVEPPGRIIRGRVMYRGENLADLGERRLRELRGNRISMIFQDPMMSLNPVLRIETLMVETLLAHQRLTRRQARVRACEALARVGIAAPAERLAAYPHQLSGGMRQRVAIAIALLNEPDILIADEPTTALDVTIQAQILYEVQKLCSEKGTALIWISHDLSVVAGLADKLCVMYAGRLVESGPIDAVLDAPLHPYTDGLIRSLPSRNPRGQPLHQIPGTTPSLLDIPAGCAFRTRCARADAACTVPPDTGHPAPGRSLRCHHPIQEAAA